MAKSEAERFIRFPLWLHPIWVWLVGLIATIAFTGWILTSSSVKASSTTPSPCFDPPGTAPWPVPAANGLGMGYLQVQVQAPSEMPFVHVGIDVLAAATTPVRAIEAGEIVLEGGEDPDSWFVVESATQPGTGFLYKHLITSAYTMDNSDGIAVGDVIAEVVDFTHDTSGKYDHLHLERVEGYDDEGAVITAAGVVWHDYLSFENPLRGLEPTAESISPVFIDPELDEYPQPGQTCAVDMPSAGAWPFWIRASKDTATYGEFYCPNELPKGELLDIVCRVEDQVVASDGLALSPCCVHVSIVHKQGNVPEVKFDVLFDGDPPMGEGPDYYWSFLGVGVLHSGGVWSLPRTLYLIVTNQPTSDGAWQPNETGEYTITIEIRDATGNVAQRSMDVTVIDP